MIKEPKEWRIFAWKETSDGLQITTNHFKTKREMLAASATLLLSYDNYVFSTDKRKTKATWDYLKALAKTSTSTPCTNNCTPNSI